MATKKAYVKYVKGQANELTFLGKSDSNHWITMDAPGEEGGHHAGVGPKELLLLGLAGCTGSDIVTILRKKRVQTDDFELNVTAEVSDEHPKVFTKLNVEYVFYGENIPQKDVERAIELSLTKYCSVTKMLEKAVPITHSFRIEARKEAPAEI